MKKNTKRKMSLSHFFRLLLQKTRFVNPRLIFLFDLILSLTASYMAVHFVAYALRREVNTLAHHEIFVFSFFFSTASLLLCGTYKGIIRHSTMAEAGRIALSAIIKIGLMTPVAAYLLKSVTTRFLFIGAVADLMLTFTFFVLFRVIVLVSYRYIFYTTYTRRRAKIFIYTGGKSSVNLEGTILNRLGLYSIEGYIRIGRFSILRVGNYTQYSVPDFESFSRLITAKKIKYILFTNRCDLDGEVERLVRFCERLGVKMLLLPKADLVDTSHGLQIMKHIPEVKIEDLLGRDEIKINLEDISSCLDGKTVLVTGSAGSIGSELCRQLCKFGIKELVMFDSAETPLHNVRLEFDEKCRSVKFHPIIGDVRSEKRLDYVFRNFHPQIVFHAAAYKHVPLMEENPCEAVITNVLGTRLVADKAVEYGVEKFVMVSTDKAVNPTNVMGATKRIAEIYVQSLSLAIASGKVKGRTRFITTRFGNVLGSNGSVIPRFREQIMKGGPVTVTHPDIIRYFMTIPEACRLVLEAAAMGSGDEIFVFDMGTPVRIADMARRMIELSGLEPGKDIDIVYTGLRPGEKLYEELLATKENTLSTPNRKIFRARVREYDYKAVTETINRLIPIARKVDRVATVKIMKELVPEFISNNSKYSVLDTNVTIKKNTTMKKVLTMFFIFLATLSGYGQSVSNDTIRQDLTKNFLSEIGDTTDVIVTNISGTGNWFVSLAGGINSLHAEANRLFDSSIERSRFAAQLSVGKWFVPQFGVRLQMGTGFLRAYYYPFRYYNLYDYMPDHTIKPDGVLPYITKVNGETVFLRKFAYSDWSLSLMTDVVRWFTTDKRRIGFYLFIGPGFTYTYPNQGLEGNSSFALKMSGQFNVRVHENWDVFAELHGTIVDESFDGQIGGLSDKVNRTLEGYAGVSLGVSYRFGGKRFDRYVKVNPIVHQSIMRTVTNVVEKPMQLEDRIVTTFAVRFYIDQHTINEDQTLNMERIARHMKRDPEYKVRLSGFADKETAYPEYNQRLSERRVNSVKKYLVEECGIDPSRIVLNPQGDKVRVYEEDFRWNRVVVMTLFKENDQNNKDNK